MYSAVFSNTRQHRSQKSKFQYATGDVLLTSADKDLRGALQRLQQSAAEEPDFGIDLPHAGTLRMRTLVHRGTQRPVFKITSFKLGRVVQCESVLEVDVVLCLDANPDVASYGEQPVRIRYLQDGIWRSHIPDFAVLIGDQITLVEVKFEQDVDDDVRMRTLLMQAALMRFGVRYQLLTDMEIRKGEEVQNSLRLLRRARHTTSEMQLLCVLERLRNTDGLTLAAFGWDVPESPDATCIARLIVRGMAEVEVGPGLTGASQVWPIESNSQRERTSW